MSCFHPVTAYQRPEGGALVFHDRGDCVRTLSVPCGQCLGCRIDRQTALAVRAGHEVRMADAAGRLSWFPTLTCDDAHLGELLRDARAPLRELQGFFKRLRSRLCDRVQVAGRRRVTRRPAVRYLFRFEYSPELMRPHFHGLLFGVDLPDVERVRASGKFPAFSSKLLDSCWPFGHIDLRLASHEAAMYVARHHVDKVTGKAALARYSLRGVDGVPLVDASTGEQLVLPPEFLTVSRRPGLGHDWVMANWQDIYRRGDAGGSVVLRGGRRLKVPPYYDRLLADRLDVDMDGVKFERQKAANSPARLADSTPERLAVREQCAAARLKLRRKR